MRDEKKIDIKRINEKTFSNHKYKYENLKF